MKHCEVDLKPICLSGLIEMQTLLERNCQEKKSAIPFRLRKQGKFPRKRKENLLSKTSQRGTIESNPD